MERGEINPGDPVASLPYNRADVRHPESAALVGNGSMFALSDEKGLITHRDGAGRINICIALKTSEPWATSSEIDFQDTEAAKRWLLDHFPDWNDQLRALITESEAELSYTFA